MWLVWFPSHFHLIPSREKGPVEPRVSPVTARKLPLLRHIFSGRLAGALQGLGFFIHVGKICLKRKLTDHLTCQRLEPFYKTPLNQFLTLRTCDQWFYNFTSPFLHVGLLLPLYLQSSPHWSIGCDIVMIMGIHINPFPLHICCTPNLPRIQWESYRKSCLVVKTRGVL